MQLSIDGVPLKELPDDVRTLEDLLRHVRQNAEGRIVVGVHLDGEALPGDRIDAIRTTALAELGPLDLETASPLMLAATALGQTAEMLEQCREHHLAIAELIAAGKTARAMDRLNECFSVWNAVERSVRQTTGALGLDLDEVQIGPIHAGQLATELARHLQEIHNHLKHKDFVGIADLVEYELLEASDQWQALLVGLQDHLLAGA